MSSRQHRYRILMELGEGGTAHVFLAIAKGPGGFNKLVVLKALKRTLAGDDEFRRMFMNEAKLSARLNHPNIVQVNEVIEQDGLPIIVMQYLEGRPLLDLINRAGDKLPPGVHLQIIGEALSGLHYSHELCDFDGTPLRVIHRDVTPHNIFVTFDGQVKLLDFGIAKLSGSTAETQAGILKGKIRYMPPEQLLGEVVDRRTDIYAVGVLLWEATTGKRMWRTLSEAAIMNRVLEGQLPPPRAENPEIDEELERIIMKALAKKAEDRYPTALALQAELEAYMAERKLGASPREMASFLSALFADYRQETKKAIEEKLAKEGSLNWADSIPISIAPSANVSLQSKELLAPRKSSWDIVAWTVAVSAIGGLLLFFVAARRHETKPTPAESRLAASASSQTARPSSTMTQTMVSIRISATPKSASILIDGKPMPGNPANHTVPNDRDVHTVTVQAIEYKPRFVKVTFDRDQEIVVALERTVLATNAALRGPQRANLAPTTATSADPVKDCNSPVYVDERGIKHFKAGCL